MNARRRFFSHWQNWLGIVLVAGFVFVALAAPLLSPNDSQNPSPMKVIGNARNQVPQPPSEEAPLGTLANQVSVYHALVWGTRSALIFGVLVTAVVAVIGTLIGTVSAYFGGFVNRFLMWITDTFLAFPVIAGVVLIQQLKTITLYNFGIRIDRWGIMSYNPSSEISEAPKMLTSVFELLQRIDPVLIAFILFLWMPYARVMNTSVLRIKQSEYVMAAKVSGVRNSRIIFRYLIPNAIAPVIVMAAKDIGGFVVLQSVFAFIGFGKGSSPWATVLVEGRNWIYAPKGMLTYWWVFLPATLILVLFGLGWNLLGDSINDVLNPRVDDTVNIN